MRSAVRLVLLMGLLVFAGPLRAADAPVVVILPFEVSSAERVDYLRQTLVHLLAGRLADRSTLTVVPPWKVMEALQSRAGRPLTDEEARELGKSFGAQYVLSAKFTAVGEGFRLDGRVLEVATERELGPITINGDRLANLMPRMTDLADAVTKNFPGFARASGPAVATIAPSTGRGPAAPALSPTAPWVSRRLPFEIRGLGLGDVTGDGTTKIVVLSKREVRVYQREEKDLKPVASYDLGLSLEGLAVDVADLNRNGVAEIYVTAVGNANAISSLVLEWAGGKLRPIETELPYYLRIVSLPEGPTLVGQRKASDKAFDGPVRRMVWQGGKLGPGAGVRVPGQVTVYSFAVADLDGDGQPEVVSLQPRTPLTIYTPGGTVISRGTDYGQTGLWVLAKRGSNNDTDEGIFLPGRILVVQLPGEGTAVLMSRNHEALAVLDRLRSFRNGEVVALRWQIDQLGEIWQTDRFVYVADFQVGALEKGREPMLVVGSVAAFSGIFSSATSYVTLLPLQGAPRP